MRSVRTIAIACVAAVCAMGALSAPAFAKPKEKLIFGKFVASREGKTRGKGEITELTLGPYKFTGEIQTEEKTIIKEVHGKIVEEKKKVPIVVDKQFVYGPICKPLVVTGTVEEGESETLTQTVKFPHCIAYRNAGKNEAGTSEGGLLERVVANFSVAFEFHSNHSGTTGEAEPKSATLEEGTVVFKGSKSTCEIEIESQDIPLNATEEADENGEKEFEAALYETEEEELSGNKAEEKKFGPVRDRLDIETEFKKVKTVVPETAACQARKGGEEDEFGNGVIDMHLGPITLANGNLSFVPPAEA